MSSRDLLITLALVLVVAVPWVAMMILSKIILDGDAELARDDMGIRHHGGPQNAEKD